MMSRLGWAGIALLALLVAVPPSAAQESASAAAADTTSKAPAVKAGAIPGHASVGGSIGGSYFVADGDYSTGALPRFSFAGAFRYVFTDTWRMQVSPGFTWSAYAKDEPPPFTDPRFPTDTSKEGSIAQLAPVSFQLQYAWRKNRTLWHVGAGPGLYHVVVQNEGKTLEDPITFAPHRGTYLGGTVEFGYERFLKSLPTTSVEVTLENHFVLATRDDQFPSGWNSPIDAVALRIGMNYYFDVAVVDREARKLPPSSSGSKKK